MNKPPTGAKLAVDISERSRCSVMVGAALVDNKGIFSWGWNSEGFDGHGLCAERHAIMRANKKRLSGATIFVASTRRRNHKVITSKPCNGCQNVLDKWNIKVVWRNSEGDWIYE